jgi:uncharacterized protein (DUF2141 family)
MNTTKNILMLSCLGLLPVATLVAQDQEIKVSINNVRDDIGTVWVALHLPAEEYMKDRYMWFKVPAQKGNVSGIFKDVPDGTYAISVMHDFNNNRELDKNAFGIPQEGFGFSNDAMGRFGPPDFKKASFEVPNQKEVIIKMRYM